MRTLALISLIAAPLASQGSGDYLNFESPQLKPIAVARVSGHDYVLCCNTPAGLLEIYDTIGNRLASRVRVGQEPISVVWNGALSRAFVCNFIGDSISVVHLSASSATAPLAVRFEHTTWVGDEPMMLAFAPDNLTFFVTHNQQSAMGWRFTQDFKPVAAGFGRILLTDSVSNPRQALKEPRAILWANGALLALGFRGGHSFFVDSDLWSFDVKTQRWATLGTLGSVKTNMAAASNGDLWVVGGDAQNSLVGVHSVAAAKTGFLTSILHKVTNPALSTAKVVTRDLNGDGAGNAVAKAKSLAHPMDVALFEQNGTVEKVFVAAFHSDRIGTIVAKDPDPNKWTVRVSDVPVAKNSPNKMAGPRGLAIKYAIKNLAGDPGDRLYVLNRLDNALGVFDPATEKVVSVVALSYDPTPVHVRAGRPFHYDARMSGSGFVACASCHIDGRTDGLAWDLSNRPSDPRTPLDPRSLDGATDSRLRGATQFPNPKGRMVTQSMQGLVNWEVRDEIGFLFTNAPYHWRGDTDFAGFNGAFVTLQGMTDISGPKEPARGLSRADLKRFEVFVNSIAYPPNPEQRFDRVYTGDFGDPDKPDGSGGLGGMKLFHTERIVAGNNQPTAVTAGRSCVQCHFLPEGSNNRITRIGVSTPQPIETAALRGLAQKEGVVERNSTQVSTITTTEFGAEHQGNLRSINDFNIFVFGHDFQNAKRPRLDAMTQFVREFDTGVAPLVGFPCTIDKNNVKSPDTTRALDILEAQASRANIGLSVHGFAATPAGWWFQPDARSGSYRDAATGRELSRSALLATLQAGVDRLVFQATPLGDERRIAVAVAKPRPLTGLAPSRITLEPAVPSSAWARVPELTKNWKPGKLSDPLAFAWTGVWSGTTVPVAEPPSLRMVRLLQYGLIQDGPALGLTKLRHEAPRRFRVSGRDIRRGAKLVLYVPDDPTGPPPYASLDKTIPLVLPLHPTHATGTNGDAVWETAEEMEPALLYALCLGGFQAPGVGAAFANSLAEPPKKGAFDPGRWNKHLVLVINEDATYGSGGWQPLRIQ
jgi:hypothetical protein